MNETNLKMSEEDQSQQTIIAPVRPQDRRVAELEELRKKQLAKSRLEDTAGMCNSHFRRAFELGLDWLFRFHHVAMLIKNESV